MPIYAFRCAKCHTHFDQLFRQSQPAPKKINCPHCNSTKVSKLVSAPRFNRGVNTTSNSDAEAIAPESTLFGRKELNVLTKKRKQAGLPA